jgi:transposase InsO family protein
MINHGLTERYCLRVIGMSASAYCCESAQDRNRVLKEKIITLAQRHRRYGSGMIYLKLRQAGEIVNHKRVDRLCAEVGLQVNKRRRKKLSLSDRHPLERPTAANQVWSMDFVFDRTAEGRSIKRLTVVDDATHQAVAIVPERALGRNQLVRILEQLAVTRGLPKAIRTDNGKEFCSRAVLTWANARGVQLFLIEPDKPNQNAYIESFNCRFRDECLNEHWFTSLPHARVVGKVWRQEYNEEKPKRSLGGLAPVAYAKTRIQKQLNYPPDSKAQCY